QLRVQLGVDEMDVVPVPLSALLRQEVVVHDQLIVLAVYCQHSAVPRDLLHEVLEAPGVDFGDRGQARLSPFGRSDVGREDLDAGKARLDELVETGDHVGRSAVRVDAGGGIVRVRLTAPRLRV